MAVPWQLETPCLSDIDLSTKDPGGKMEEWGHDALIGCFEQYVGPQLNKYLPRFWQLI